MSIDEAISKLQKTYGVQIGPIRDANGVTAIPTGIIQLDLALGIGGIPLGYFVEVYSRDGVGKTTLCAQIAASAQREGYSVAYIDMEQRFDPTYARRLGVDLESLYFTQPPYGEAALDVARGMVEAGIKLVVVDSVAALVPKCEVDGDVGDVSPGAQARMMSKFLRVSTPIMKRNGATIIFANQTRSKMGGGGFAFGPQTVTSGGVALKFYASVRLKMAIVKTLKRPNSVPYGHIARVTVDKNSLGIPKRTADIVLRYGVGFDPRENLVDAAIASGLITQSGGWYEVPSGARFHGKGRLVLDISDDDLSDVERAIWRTHDGEGI